MGKEIYLECLLECKFFCTNIGCFFKFCFGRFIWNFVQKCNVIYRIYIIQILVKALRRDALRNEKINFKQSREYYIKRNLAKTKGIQICEHLQEINILNRSSGSKGNRGKLLSFLCIEFSTLMVLFYIEVSTSCQFMHKTLYLKFLCIF